MFGSFPIQKQRSKDLHGFLDSRSAPALAPEMKAALYASCRNPLQWQPECSQFASTMCSLHLLRPSDFLRRSHVSFLQAWCVKFMLFATAKPSPAPSAQLDETHRDTSIFLSIKKSEKSESGRHKTLRSWKEEKKEIYICKDKITKYRSNHSWARPGPCLAFWGAASSRGPSSSGTGSDIFPSNSCRYFQMCPESLRVCKCAYYTCFCTFQCFRFSFNFEMSAEWIQ